MKQVRHTHDVFLLPDFTKPNHRDLAKRSHKGGYQLGKSAQGFPI